MTTHLPYSEKKSTRHVTIPQRKQIMIKQSMKSNRSISIILIIAIEVYCNAIHALLKNEDFPQNTISEVVKTGTKTAVLLPGSRIVLGM